MSIEQKLLLKRELRIRASRDSLWEYCRTESPEFYTNKNWHLHLICEVLQALYMRKLTKQLYSDLIDEICPPWYHDTVDWDRLIDVDPLTGEQHIYTKLMQNIPPRLGKSRTLVNFCKWALGKDQENRVITCSYGDDLAMDFSRFTRDGIQEEATYPTDIVFSNIFPACKVKQGDSSYQKWSLEGQFFNYKGAGVGGAITGKGCNISIVDDPVKDAEQALNPAALEKIWLWYTGTFMSRLEENGLEIVNMTRWAKMDVCGQILDGEEAGDWLILAMEAVYFFETFDEEGNRIEDEKGNPVMRHEMLCSQLLGFKRYETLRKAVPEEIHQANYHQKPLDVKGRLYPEFKTYQYLPMDDNGNLLTERVINYTDTADEGKDYLAAPIGHVYQGEFYITDFVYSKAAMDITEPMLARALFDQQVSFAKFESNNGGRGFARAVGKILTDEYKTNKTSIDWFYQGKNKIARILTNSTYVINHIYFPEGWKDRWPELAKNLYAYQKEGGANQEDGAPDALTGIAEMIIDGDYAGLIEWMKQQILLQKIANGEILPDDESLPPHLRKIAENGKIGG